MAGFLYLSAIQRVLGYAEPSKSLEYIAVSGDQLSRVGEVGVYFPIMGKVFDIVYEFPIMGKIQTGFKC